MGFFDLFTLPEQSKYINNLHSQFVEHFPKMSEERISVLACLAGLLARVAYADFEVTDSEVDHMHDALVHWIKISEEEATFVAKIAVKEMKDLAGLDTRKYCTPLVEILDVDDRFSVLETLFELAAADGSVDNIESNEISYIAKALVLEQKHFISARAKVSQYLTSLK